MNKKEKNEEIKFDLICRHKTVFIFQYHFSLQQAAAIIIKSIIEK